MGVRPVLCCVILAISRSKAQDDMHGAAVRKVTSCWTIIKFVSLCVVEFSKAHCIVIQP